MTSKNSPQKVLKSIDPQEQILMSITKKVEGKDFEKILNGLVAFTKCFEDADKYKIDIKVEKVIEPIECNPNET